MNTSSKELFVSSLSSSSNDSQKNESQGQKSENPQESCVDTVVVPPNLKKLRKRTPFLNIRSQHPKLRVMKRDIRYRYTEIYNNVLNHPDADLLIAFFKDFCRPDCLFFVSVAPGLPKSTKIGAVEISRQAMEYRKTIPDGVQYLSDSKIHTPSDQSGSSIVSTITFKGTRVFEIQPEASNRTVSSPSVLSTSTSHNNSSERFYGKEGEQKILSEIESIKLSRMRQPREMCLRGVFSMHLDEANRFERFSMTITDIHVQVLSSS